MKSSSANFKQSFQDFIYKHIIPVALILSIILFAIIYYVIDLLTEEKQFNSEKNQNFIWNKIYFSLVTQSTVGYGDIYPITLLAKVFVSIQIFVTMVLIYYIGMYILSGKSKTSM